MRAATAASTREHAAMTTRLQQQQQRLDALVAEAAFAQLQLNEQKQAGIIGVVATTATLTLSFFLDVGDHLVMSASQTLHGRTAEHSSDTTIATEQDHTVVHQSRQRRTKCTITISCNIAIIIITMVYE